MTDQELEKLLAEMANKNSVKPDAGFSRALNFKLHQEINKLNNKPVNNINQNYFMKKFGIILGGGVVAALALMLIFINVRKPMPSTELGKAQITYAGKHAFGKLTNITSTTADTGTNATPQSATAPSMGSKMAFGMGGGGTGVATAPDALIYRPINYTFKYTGDPITIDGTTTQVFERQAGFPPVALASFLSGFNLNNLDISKFANANLDYITASQDQDYGYQLSLDMRRGTVNIGENYDRWMTPDRKCMDDACFQQYKMTLDQVPADEEIIGIANSFLDDYGIDKTQYGKPTVQNDWRIQYDQTVKSQGSTFAYIPDSASVIYPIKLDGKEVFDEGGNPSGIYVTVNLRVKKVSYISELSSQNYNASDYDTEQDTDKLVKLAESGGYRSYPMYINEGGKTLELELGTPKTQLVRMWQTRDNVTHEIYVPSLIFPVTTPSDTVYIKNVVVPIVKEILDTPQIIPPYKILDSTGVGSSGSGTVTPGTIAVPPIAPNKK